MLSWRILSNMDEQLQLHIVARIHSDFTSKFGIPRQSNLVQSLETVIVFEPPYRDENALRGLEGYSHLWLIWGFSEVHQEGWSPTVKPPKLGGNTRMGVFATRSPFRPNPIGLSCVKIEAIHPQTADGPVIVVSGADLMNGTPIYDIKPYLPYADCRPDAKGGFADAVRGKRLTVDFPPELLARVPREHRAALMEILAQDPRPSYQHDPQRVYGMAYAGMDVRFTVDGERLTVTEIANA